MIPIRLEAHHFMTYQTLELDFTQFRIACLSGHNGSGKSTILDAITWVLWGESRASDEEAVIRLGEHETRVELTFQLESEIYRVQRIRKRSRPGKRSGGGNLHFQVDTSQGPRSLDGKNMTETQRHINETLRMNYSLFIHSSFILQGRADVFTVSPASTRKKILGEILNLEIYDRLQVEAKKHLEQFNAERQQLRLILEQLAQAQGRSTEVAVLLVAAQLSHQEIVGLREQAEQQEQKQQQDVHTQMAAVMQLEQVATQAAQLQTNLHDKQQQMAGLTQQRQEQQQVLQRQTEIEQGYQQWQQCQQQQQTLAQQLEQVHQWQQQQTTLQQQLQTERHRLELRHQQLAQQLSHLEQQQQQLQRVLSEKDKIIQGFTQYESARQLLEQSQAQWQAHQELEREYTELEAQRQNVLRQLELEHQRQVAALEEMQRQLTDHEHLEQAWEKHHHQLQEINKHQLYFEKVKEEGIQLKQFIEQTQQQCQGNDQEMQQIRDKISGFKAQMESLCPLCERLLTQGDIQVLVDKYEQNHESLAQERIEKQHQIGQWEKRQADLRQEYSRLQRELKERDHLQQQLGQLEQQRQTNQQLQQSMAQLQQTCSRIAEQLQQQELPPALQQRWQQITQQRQDLLFEPREHELAQAAVRDWQWAETKHKELGQAEATLSELGQQHQQVHQEWQHLEQILAQQLYLPEAQARLQELATQLAQWQDIAQQLQAVRQQVEQWAVFEQEWPLLQQALTRHSGLVAQQEQLQQQLAIEATQLQQWHTQLAQLTDLKQALSLSQGQLQRQQEQLQQWREQEKNRHAHCYALEQEQQGLQEQLQILASTQEQLQIAEQESYLYKELTDMFSKNGLPALIIENAIPEIEHVANQMLAQMTDGRMHVHFQTLKSLKTKDKLDETLEIYISDELGTRSYETYSAGEAFRVNFAIRLAISKFLARRAGARLQTLVIDEGFGSQDSDGKTRIVEAINTVVDDFEKILVITHVEDLKALFPCRIEVVKMNTGSQIKVIV